MKDFVSKYCKGEVCKICGKSAVRKVEEVIFNDHPIKFKKKISKKMFYSLINGNFGPRHPLVAYLCKEHFDLVMFNYQNVETFRTELSNLPAIWYPSLIDSMVIAAYKKNVFVKGGISKFIRGLEKKMS